MGIQVFLHLIFMGQLALGSTTASATREFAPEDFRATLIAAGLNEESLVLVEQEMAQMHYSKSVVGIVNFSLPSNRPRFFVIDRDHRLFRIYPVAHASGSGGLNAVAFSNVTNSHKSSLGFIKTGNVYSGKFGRSLKLEGISESDSALAHRTIVLHSAEYSSDAFLAKFGFWGRSFGCLAVPQDNVDEIIDTLGSGALLLAYHDQAWKQILQHPEAQELAEHEPIPVATAWETEENEKGDPSPHHAGNPPTHYYIDRFGR